MDVIPQSCSVQKHNIYVPVSENKEIVKGLNLLSTCLIHVKSVSFSSLEKDFKRAIKMFVVLQRPVAPVGTALQRDLLFQPESSGEGFCR